MTLKSWLKSILQSRASAPTRKRLRRAFSRQLLTETLETRVLMAGDLDASFGNGGIVTTNFVELAFPFNGWSDSASSLALQANGKIVVAGTTQPNGGPNGVISRYNSDGSLDALFSGDGKISEYGFSEIRDVAIQSNGQIVVIGNSPGGGGNFAVGRYNDDGSPDTSFGTGGIVTTVPGAYNNAYSVALLDNVALGNVGKILVVGQSGQPGPEQPYGFTLQQFNPNGTVDTSFGDSGQVRTFYSTAEIGPGYARAGNVGARDLAVQPDGKIIVAGHSLNGDASNLYQNGFAVVRYNPDGSLDTSFDMDGRAYTNLGTGQHWVTRMALQADGKMILGGYLLKLSPVVEADFAMVRYNTDGSLDTTFDGDGKLIVDFGNTDDYVNDVKVQSDGVIVVTGSVGNSLAVARFNSDGSPDASFGTNGLVTTAIQASASGSEVVIQPNGAIVVAGTVNNGNGNQFLNRDFVVARYHGINPVAVSIAAANDANETGSVNGRFTISLDAASAIDTLVTYSVLASSSATAGTDYATLSGTLTIPAGDLSADITVSGIANDPTVEFDETISIQLTGSTAGTSFIFTASDTATISLLDNDSAVMSIGNASVTEGNSGTTVLSYPVTLSNPVDVDVSIDYATQDGTATAGSDYVAQSGTLIIPAGSTTGTIDITVNGDTVVELDETLELLLSNLQANGADVALIGPSTVIYSNDFEGGVTDWTDNTTSTELTSVYTEFLGRFDGSTVNSTTINVGAATTVVVSFDMFEFNSWDTELFQVFANGVLVVNDSFAQEDNYGDYDGTTKPNAISIDNRAPLIPDTFGHLTEIWHYEFIVNTTGPTLNLSFGSTLNQSAYDESWGIDNLTVTASLNATTATATGTIVNDDFNTPPVANADLVRTDEDNAVTFNVLGNDTDAENNIVASLTAALSSPTAGVLTDNGSGSFTFNTNGAFESLATGDSAQVSFEYRIEDAYGATDTATVTITITGVNDAATIIGDNAGDMTEDANGDSGVLTVDDLDDAENVFQPVLNAAGTYGTFSINAAGNWSYTRTADLQFLAGSSSVTDSFTVTSFDGTGTEVVAITITGENDAPTITVGGPVNLITNGSFEAEAVGNVPGWANGPGSMTGGSGTGNFVGGLDGVTGVDGSQLLFMFGHDGGWSLEQAISSTAGVEHTLGFAYGKAGDWFRQATTRAQIFLASNLVTPIADTGALNPGLSPNGTDRTNLFQAGLTFTPAESNLVIRFTETSARRVFTTLDNVVLTAASSDTTYVENDAATVIQARLILNDVDDANLESATVAITGGFQAGADVLGFINQNGITGSYNAASGVLTLSGTATVAQYQAALASVTYLNSSENPSETDRTISFIVNDGSLNSLAATSTVKVVAVNDVATISGDNVGAMTEDGTGDNGVLTVSDVDNGQNVFQPVTNAAGTYGTFSINAAGTWSYTRTANLQSLAVGASVTDSFTVISLDGTASKVVTITITGLNDAPVLNGVSSNHATVSNASANGVVTISGSFSDIDTSDTHVATVNWGDGTVATVSVIQLADTLAGSHTYQNGGIYTVTVSVSDGKGGTASSTTTAVVQGVGIVNGTLYVIGTDGPDDVNLNSNARRNELTIDVKLNQTGGSGGIRKTFAISSITRIDAYLNAGDDQYNGSNATISQFVFGGNGNDAISTGSGNDTIVDMLGNNAIDAGLGNDTVTTGSGNDVIRTGSGDNLVNAGDGNNEIYAFGGNDRVTAGSGNDLISTDGGNDTIQAGDGDNEIRAGGGNNFITAGSGNDLIWANGGDDVINAGDGNNQIRAGRGKNIVNAGNGNDQIWTSGDDDTINAGNGNNIIRAGNGVNRVTAGSGNDRIFTGSGNDTIDAGSGNDTINAGDGNNAIDAGSGDDSVSSGAGIDSIDAGDGNDIVRAGAGNDTIQGGSGDDILAGGDGNDLIQGGQGRDILIGGIGADRLIGDQDEDILIAGYTSWDNNSSTNNLALTSILREWSSSNSYATRVGKITNGGGLNGLYRLVGDDGADQTVFNDNDVDTLTGSQGVDWFFANRENTNGGNAVMDIVTDKSGSEFWSDTDF